MLGFALIGCGKIAQRHAELLGSNRVEGARLSAVCDIDREKALAIGERMQVPGYTDVESMIQHEDIDVLSVLTPSGMHAEQVAEFSKYKKHIVVEKPMALSLDDSDKMIRACSTNECRLFVVMQNRFNVPVIQLRRALESGRFGKLVLGTVCVRWCRRQDYYDQDKWRCSKQHGGGVLANQANHHVDMLRWLMGEVESVYARGATALVDVEVEDTAAVIIKFKNGALGIIEATTATRPKDIEGAISILGEKGSVEIGGFAMNELRVWQFDEEREQDKDIFAKYSANPPEVSGYSHKEYLKHVTDCIRNNKKTLISGTEGRKSLELTLAIYRSIETAKEVYI